MVDKMPSAAIIIARVKKKDPEQEPSKKNGGSSDGPDEERLSEIAKDVLKAIAEKDPEALRDCLCEFLHEYEESDSESDGGEY